MHATLSQFKVAAKEQKTPLRETEKIIALRRDFILRAVHPEFLVSRCSCKAALGNNDDVF